MLRRRLANLLTVVGFHHPPFPCRLDHSVGRESESGSLRPPVLVKRILVNVALVGARHQGGALCQVGIASRIAEAAFVHRGLDLRPPGGEGLDHRARHTGNLEAPVGMGLLDRVAQLVKLPCQLVSVDHSYQLLPPVLLLSARIRRRSAW